MTDRRSKPKDMIKYSPNPPVKITALPSICIRVKKYFEDQYTQYGSKIPRVTIDNNINPRDMMKYSPNPPVKITFFLILFVF